MLMGTQQLTNAVEITFPSSDKQRREAIRFLLYVDIKANYKQALTHSGAGQTQKWKAKCDKRITTSLFTPDG